MELGWFRIGTINRLCYHWRKVLCSISREYINYEFSETTQILLVSNSTEVGPSSEADGCSPVQDIPTIPYNPKVP
jgi:hypothetical protein